MISTDREKLYTVRWYINKVFEGAEHHKDECRRIIAELLGETSPQDAKDEERVETTKPAIGKKELYYPLALRQGLKSMKTQGEYRKGYPEGAIIHWTAGHWDADLTAQTNNAAPYCYFMIDRKGEVSQAFPLNRWGSHAGASEWKGLGKSVSQYLVGIEVMCAGKVEKKGERYVPWFGRAVPKDEIVFSKKDGNITEGFYQRYTPEQFDSLTHLLLWLKGNNPDVFKIENVIGHDECATPLGRKTDPGASLVDSVTGEIYTVAEYRTLLQMKYSELLRSVK
jgi:hypothetical protein